MVIVYDVMQWLPIFFHYGILQRNYREMTISYNYFVQVSLYNIIHVQHVHSSGPQT